MVYNLGEVQPGCRIDVFKADSTVTKYGIVTINADGEVVAYAAAAAPTGIVGIALDAATAAGQLVRVAYAGNVVIAAPAAVKKGGLVQITNAAGTATIGIALEDASSGAAVLVKLIPVVPWAAASA